VLTLIAAGLIVAALAFYLITIAAVLWRVLSNLKKIKRAVEAIGKSTEPIGPIVEDINSDLSIAAGALAATLGEQPKAS
jgi:hypothetical protein